MMRKINVETSKGTVLRGNIFKSNREETVVIIITGVEGNICNNNFYNVLGKKLAENGIDFVVAHTRDAFNATSSFNKIIGKVETYGAGNESFADSDLDIGAYVNWSALKGYRHIILGGQSLGANKVIHYLSQNINNSIERFLLLSPVNIDALRNNVPLRQKDLINQQISGFHNERELPFKLFRWLSCNVETGYAWMHDNTLNNVHFDTKEDFIQVEKIRNRGGLLIGTHDRFAGGEPTQYLKNINNHFEKASDNDLVFLKDAGHIYRGKENQLANKVLKLLQKWGL